MPATFGLFGVSLPPKKAAIPIIQSPENTNARTEQTFFLCLLMHRSTIPSTSPTTEKHPNNENTNAVMLKPDGPSFMGAAVVPPLFCLICVAACVCLGCAPCPLPCCRNLSSLSILADSELSIPSLTKSILHIGHFTRLFSNSLPHFGHTLAILLPSLSCFCLTPVLRWCAAAPCPAPSAWRSRPGYCRRGD